MMLEMSVDNISMRRTSLNYFFKNGQTCEGRCVKGVVRDTCRSLVMLSRHFRMSLSLAFGSTLSVSARSLSACQSLGLGVGGWGMGV